MSDIKITLPDGSVKEFPAGVTALDIAKSISSRLAKEAIVAKVDGVLVDLTRPINADANVELLDAETPEGLEVLRHSAAHLMAQAIRRLYPDVKLAIGPVVDNRFYYDLQCDKAISSEDFPAIEAEMERIVKEKLPIERVEVAKERAYQQWSDENEPFKLEILEDLEDGHITIYKQGEFTDLCRGPHVPNTSYLKATKLLSVAGAYWRGDA
ncbi:MAG TPA: TGS domain-containing protein, partial [Firmicutes bacterium]|nr:TGS domain-containing protein [Bacillota bacterium]